MLRWKQQRGRNKTREKEVMWMTSWLMPSCPWKMWHWAVCPLPTFPLVLLLSMALCGLQYSLDQLRSAVLAVSPPCAPQPLAAEGRVRGRRGLDAVQALRSSNGNIPALAALPSTNPKRSPVLAAVKKINSSPQARASTSSWLTPYRCKIFTSRQGRLQLLLLLQLLSSSRAVDLRRHWQRGICRQLSSEGSSAEWTVCSRIIEWQSLEGTSGCHSATPLAQNTTLVHQE